MANYDATEEGREQLTGAIDDAVASGQLSSATNDIIAGLIAGMALDQLPNVIQSTDVGTATLPDTPVVMMAENAKFDAQIPADSPIRFVQTAPGVGSNNITFTTDQDVAVALGGGANDKVTTAGGDDAITFVGASNASAVIDTGAGNDNVYLRSAGAGDNGGTADVSTGEGADVINWGSDSNARAAGSSEGWDGKATIDTGSGDDTVNLNNSASGEASISTGAGEDTVNWGSEYGTSSWTGNATINTGEGNDHVRLLNGGGEASISTGAGDDHVRILETWNGKVTVETGDGKDTLILANNNYNDTSTTSEVVANLGAGQDTVSLMGPWSGKATVDGGTGFDELQVNNSSRHLHSFRYANGNVVMDGYDGDGITLQNVNVVGFGDNVWDGVTTVPRNITVLANTAGDALIAKLYQVALGREAIDNAYGTNGVMGNNSVTGAYGGLSYWTEVYNNGNNSANLTQTAYDFLGAGEFQHLYGGMDDQTFIIQLFHNLDKADGQWNALTEINGKTVQDFVNQLNGTQESRWDAAIEIANSAEAVQILGQDGNQYIIADTGSNSTPESA